MMSAQACCVCQQKPSPRRGNHKKCGGCQIPLYCGKICQKEHWRKVHMDHCSKILIKYQDYKTNDLDEEFMKMLRKDQRFNLNGVQAAVQTPLKDTGDILDDKLDEMSNLSSGLEQKHIGGVLRIRVKYWIHVLVHGNSFNSINLFLFGIFRSDILLLAKEIFNTSGEELYKTSVSFMFTIQLMVIAADYSIANMINTERVEDSEEGHVEASKRRKEEASYFFSCWEKFSDQQGFLLLSKANCFLMKAASLETCFICQVPVPIKSCSWACAVEKTQDMIMFSVEDCPPFFRMVDGLGSVTCCGKKKCNLEIHCLFQSSLTDLKMTLELTILRPELVFSCDFCFRKSSVHRCSGCKSRWYCGEQCHVEDWKVVHKEVCGKLSKMGRKQRFNSQKRKKVAKDVVEKSTKIYANNLMDIFKKCLS